MKSKEIVCRAIERTGPCRIPMNYYNRDFVFSDTMMVGYAPAASFVPMEPGLNEWGYAWESVDGTMGQPHFFPLADWDEVEAYTPPDPAAPGRLDHAPAFLAEHGEKFIKFSVGAMGITGFNQATFLRGFENFMSDLYLSRERVQYVLDMVFNFENAMIERVCRFPIDAICFADDWGTQQGLMISPELWREVFRPRYAEQFALVHRYGKKVWFHSCGNIYSIIGDLIEIGVDVLELLQPDLLEVERLSTDFGGKVCFCCSVDHQRRALDGTHQEILVYAGLLKEKLGCFNGGFIAYIEDYSSLGMSEQQYQWIREAFHGLNDGTAIEDDSLSEGHYDALQQHLP